MDSGWFLGLDVGYWILWMPNLFCECSLSCSGLFRPDSAWLWQYRLVSIAILVCYSMSSLFSGSCSPSPSLESL